MVTPRPKRFLLLLQPDEAMRRDIELVAGGPTPAGRPELAARLAAVTQRRVDEVLTYVLLHVWLELGGDAGEYGLGDEGPGEAPRAPFEVRAQWGGPVPPEVRARAEAAFDAVWARVIGDAAAAARSKAGRRNRLPG